MARLLEQELLNIPQGANCLPGAGQRRVRPRSTPRNRQNQAALFFLRVRRGAAMARWMCSFDTTEDDVTRFAKFVVQSVNA